MAETKKRLFAIGLAILFPGLCIKSPEICIELTVRHVFQLRLDIFLFAPCCQLQEGKVINLVFETELVLVETKLDLEILWFLFIVYHVRF